MVMVAMVKDTERPFGLYELVYKDVNIDPELSTTMLHDTAIIKKVTGRERTFVEGKGKPGFHTRLHAKFFFVCNVVPEIADATNADFRRNIYIDFPKTFIDNPDSNLIYKLTTEEELSGIFNILMNALREVLRAGKISMDEKTIEKRVEKYERLIDPVRAFTKEAFVEDNDEISISLADTVTKAALYESYKRFCEKYKLAPMPENKFGGVMKNKIGFPDGRDSTGNRLSVCKGIRLKENYKKLVLGVQNTLD
jgi:putative DNA primase/helicase